MDITEGGILGGDWAQHMAQAGVLTLTVALLIMSFRVHKARPQYAIEHGGL